MWSDWVMWHWGTRCWLRWDAWSRLKVWIWNRLLTDSGYMEYRMNDINFLISLDVGDPMLKMEKCCGWVRARLSPPTPESAHAREIRKLISSIRHSMYLDSVCRSAKPFPDESTDWLWVYMNNHIDRISMVFQLWHGFSYDYKDFF